MRAKQLSLGQAMAYLDKNQTGAWQDLSESKIIYLDDLSGRLQEIEKEKKAVKIIATRGQANCDSRSTIEGDEDFFLSCLVIGHNGDKSGEVEKFIRHLNSCYKCFQVYSEVIGDYCEHSRGLS